MKTNIIKGTMITKQIGNCTLINGDCLEVLKDWSYDRVSAVVTDPPYGLSFMGKAWDHGVPSTSFWEAFKSVCYSGSPLFAFGGTRTFHRLAVAIEDAGWDLMDTLSWLYGSGFPKSYDISKGIDKQAGVEREVIGISNKGFGGGGFLNTDNFIWEKEIPITKPTTTGAKEWEGYGTALKPSWEPILFAYANKGNYVDKALTEGVSGLNIDAGRIGTEKITTSGKDDLKHKRNNAMGSSWSGVVNTEPRIGRYPANTIIDEEVATMLDEQSGVSKSSNKIRENKNHQIPIYNKFGPSSTTGYSDSGGASRFFYTAKTSPAERDGRKHPTIKPIAIMRYLVKLATYPRTNLILDPFMGSGSTIASCMLENVPAVGVEKDPDNFKEAVEWLTKFHNKLHKDGEAYGHIPKWLRTDRKETPKSNTEQIELFG